MDVRPSWKAILHDATDLIRRIDSRLGAKRDGIVLTRATHDAIARSAHLGSTVEHARKIRMGNKRAAHLEGESRRHVVDDVDIAGGEATDSIVDLLQRAHVN